MMKFSTALFLGLGLLAQGGAFAAGADDTDRGAAKKVVAYDVSAGEGARKSTMKFCDHSDDNCRAANQVNSCGAFASFQKRSGYGIAATQAAAVSKAMEMCGQSECRVVSAGCDN